MSKQREAMQFALETLEDIFGKKKIDVTAINMLREALYEPARKPLTDEDISTIVQSMSAYTWDAHMLARAIERAHGIDGGHDCWR